MQDEIYPLYQQIDNLYVSNDMILKKIDKKAPYAKFHKMLFMMLSMIDESIEVNSNLIENTYDLLLKFPSTALFLDDLKKLLKEVM